MTNITLLLKMVAHNLVNDCKESSSALKEILPAVLQDLMRVEGKNVTEMPSSFRTKNS